MALPASGEITANQIHNEVGGTSGTEVSSWDADVLALAGLSSGQEMDLNDFYGKSAGATIGGQWPWSQTILNDTPLSGTAWAGFRFETTGNFIVYQGPPDDISNSYVSSGDPTTLWVKYVVNSGDGTISTNMPAENTYYPLTADKYVYLTNSTQIYRSSNVTVTIAKDASGTGAVSWNGQFSGLVDPNQ